MAAVEAAAAAFPAWAALGPTARRAHLPRPPRARRPRGRRLRRTAMAPRPAPPGLGRLQRLLAAGMFARGGRADHADRRRGHPVRQAGRLAMARARAGRRGARHRALERADHPGRARHRHAAGLRQHRGAQGLGDLPGHARPDRRGLPRSGPARGRGQRGHQRGRGRRRHRRRAVDHPAVRRINFTGSTRVGRIVAERAARHLKPVLLELGGKAPLVVLDDADLDEAVKAAAFGAFMHQGQICMSTERIVVDAEGRRRLRGQASRQGGDAAGAATRAGPSPRWRAWSTSHRGARQRADRRRRRQGRALVIGGKADSTLMPRHVVDSVTPDMRLYSEESFGPVVAVIRANGEEEAIRSPTTPNTASRRRCSAATSAAAWRSPSRSSRASATSTDPPSRTRPDAVRRRQGLRLWPLRRQGRHRRLHRAPLDHRSRRRPATIRSENPKPAEALFDEYLAPEYEAVHLLYNHVHAGQAIHIDGVRSAPSPTPRARSCACPGRPAAPWSRRWGRRRRPCRCPTCRRRWRPTRSTGR